MQIKIALVNTHLESGEMKINKPTFIKYILEASMTD